MEGQSAGIVITVTRRFRVAYVLLALMFGAALLWVWLEPLVAQKVAAQTGEPNQMPNASPKTSITPNLDSELKVLDAEVRADSAKIDSERDRLSALDSNSRFTMTVAGLFAILLGIGAWKTLDEQRKSAEENLKLQMKSFGDQFTQLLTDHEGKLKRALEEIQRVREDVRRDFPMFGRMRQNFYSVLLSLEAACKKLPATDDGYSQLTWRQKEEILFLEKVVADSLLLDSRENSKDLSEIYRYLGVFYGSRFASTQMAAHKQGENWKASWSTSDIDRSRFYFDRSIELDQENALAYSHAGYFTMFYHDRDLARCSRESSSERSEAAC